MTKEDIKAFINNINTYSKSYSGNYFPPLFMGPELYEKMQKLLKEELSQYPIKYKDDSNNNRD